MAHGSPKDFHAFFSFSMKHKATSYSGVVTFVSKKERMLQVVRSCNDLGGGDVDSFWPQPLWDVKLLRLTKQRVKELDGEGRVVVTDHGGYFLVFNVYCPCISGDNEERRLDRTQFKNDFLAALKFRIRQMQDIGWRVVLAGDLNAYASPIDCSWEYSPTSCSSWIRDILGLGTTLADEIEKSSAEAPSSISPSEQREPHLLVDLFRGAHLDRKNAFTCWNTKTSARSTNYGSRIDYVLADPTFAKSLCMCDILPDVLGSDHCPVVAIIQVEGDRLSHVVYDDDGEGGEPPDPSTADYCCPPLCSCHFPELAGIQSSIRSYFRTLNEAPTIKPPSQPSQGKPKPSSSFTLKQSKIPFASLCRPAEAEGHSVAEGGQKPNNYEKEMTAVVVAPEVKVTNPTTTTPSYYLFQFCCSVMRSCNNFVRFSCHCIVSCCGVKKVQKDAWRKVLSGNPLVVLCTGHQEPAVLRTVLKSGANQGRRFWVCNRPKGRKGDPYAQCNHFEVWKYCWPCSLCK